MSFCPKCGRQRTTNSRFCGGCGNDFGPQAASGGTPAVAEPEEPAAFGAAEQTRFDVPVEQTRLDRPLSTAPPDRYASWYAEPSLADRPAPAGSAAAGSAPAGSAAAGSAPAGSAAADPWNAADTVYAEPTQTAGYTPPRPPAGPAYPPAYPPPAPVTAEGGSGGRRTAILVIVVVLVVLGAGGGAYALTRSHGSSTAQPPSNPTVTAPPASTAAAPASPVVNASASPTASPSVTVTPTPARPAGVQVASGVASDPAEPPVLAYLNRYFSAINSRNYNAYQTLLNAQEQQGNSQSTFDSGYATTKDSKEVLTGIEDTGGGTLTANVSFTSHQATADSADGSACNNWRISLYLVPQGSSYVMTAAPAGYHAAYSDC